MNGTWYEVPVLLAWNVITWKLKLEGLLYCRVTVRGPSFDVAGF